MGEIQSENVLVESYIAAVACHHFSLCDFFMAIYSWPNKVHVAS